MRVHDLGRTVPRGRAGPGPHHCQDVRGRRVRRRGRREGKLDGARLGRAERGGERAHRDRDSVNHERRAVGAAAKGGAGRRVFLGVKLSQRCVGRRRGGAYPVSSGDKGDGDRREARSVTTGRASVPTAPGCAARPAGVTPGDGPRSAGRPVKVDPSLALAAVAWPAGAGAPSLAAFGATGGGDSSSN